MKNNRRQFVKTGIASIAGLALGGNASGFNKSSWFISTSETINLTESVITVGRDADEFHYWVAGELQRYLLKLSGAEFPISASVEVPAEKSLIVLGTPQNNPLIDSAQKQGLVDFTGLKPDGLILKTIELNNMPAVILGGNDDRGTMYAAYELLEQLGIVFQLTNDIIPRQKSELILPALDLRMEPLFKDRGMHFNHGIRWYMGLEDIRREIDQFPKLKMNVFQFIMGMGSAYCEFSYGGKAAEIISPKESGYVAWPMGSGTAESVKVGRECFPEDGYLGPPEFANVQTQEDAYRTAREFLREIISYAHKRKVQVWIHIGEMPFVPPNLVPPTAKIGRSHYMGVSISHGEPAMLDIWEAAMLSLIENYPEAARYWVCSGTELAGFGPGARPLPMHKIPADDPQLQEFITDYENLRPVVEQRHPEIMDLDLADIAASDRLMRRIKARYPTAKLGASMIFRGSLLRPLDYILPEDIALMNMVNYRGETAMNYFDGIQQGRDLVVFPRITDDGSEMHMQLNAMMYDHDEVISSGVRYGLKGIMGQLNKARGAEQSAQYIAEGAWNARINCHSFYERYLSRLYGPDALDSLLKAFLLLEENDKALDWYGRSHLFWTWHAWPRGMELRLRTVNPRMSWLLDRQEVERAIQSAEEARKRWEGRAVHCRRAMKLILQARPLVWPGSLDELDYVIYKTENFITVFDLLIANQDTVVAYERALLAMIAGKASETRKHLEQSWDSLDRANRLSREIAGQIIPYAHIPTERHILWIFNKVIPFYETAREYLAEMIAFYEGSGR